MAILHLTFFIILNEKGVANTISQTLASNISLACVRLHSLLMTTTLSTVLTQIVWRYYGSRTMNMSTVDALFNLCTHFVSLSLPQAIFHAPSISAIAICIALVPVAMIFPPSALTVHTAPHTLKYLAHVPSYDPGIRPQPNVLSNQVNGTTTMYFQTTPNVAQGLSNERGCW